MSYDEFFAEATGNTPLHYQGRLATEPWPNILDIPTGLGKTAAVTLAWIYKRCILKDEETPRRLVYCLPMRVLVEQTHHSIICWLQKLGMLGQPNEEKVTVHLLMGGEVDRDWVLYPEANAILIGTQDMFLSRALNRGYAAGRARWPMEFGLLNNDCLWVLDEIQLMSSGLATSLQLEAWRRSLKLRNSVDGFFCDNTSPVCLPSHSLWMSATMAKHWLSSAVDWHMYTDSTWKCRIRLEKADYQHYRVRALFENRKELDRKPVAQLEKPKTKEGKINREDANRKTHAYIESLSEAIKKNRSPHGLTLVIVNTVERATALYDRLKNRLAGVDVRLIHSRFRPIERETWQQFLSGNNNRPMVIVSTQVIEAGVDISALVLFTELAPWASLVQRFGRCARYPDQSGIVYWMDLRTDENSEANARPYVHKELKEAKEKLSSLDDAGLGPLAQLKYKLDEPEHEEEVKELFPYDPTFVPRDKDLFDLFDTTPDLTGADIDISRFIRDGEELDVLVFWREVPDRERPRRKDRPDHRELCPVPFHALQMQAATLLRHGRIWRWDYRYGWKELSGNETELIYPGQIFMLEKSCGGYDVIRGWTGSPNDSRFDQLPEKDRHVTSKQAQQDAEEEADALSEAKWLSILEHSQHVCLKLEEILNGLCTLSSASVLKVLRLAARWHDRGKGHDSFKAKIRQEFLEKARSQLQGQPPAKAPKEAWRTPLEMTSKKKMADTDQSPPEVESRRPGFRHELASALGIMESVREACPDHPAFAWPLGLVKGAFGQVEDSHDTSLAHDPAVEELINLTKEEFDLLLYLVSAHHGKVRMSLRSSQGDIRTDVPDPCSPDKRQARGVRDRDKLHACRLPGPLNGDQSPVLTAPAVTLYLDPMEIGLSGRYGPSWRDRTQNLLDHLGPFRLAYLESLLRSADCRASQDEEPSSAKSTTGD